MGSGASPSAEDAPIDPSRACVYLYRRGDSARISYVGRGKTPDRALQHTEGAANAVLRELVEQGDYVVEVAGPYESPREAALVEAALISALRPSSSDADLANLVAGDGPRFRPLGLPTELAGRAAQEPLTLQEVGRRTGGALIVRNSFGADPLSDGRPRLDPVRPDDAVIRHNIVREWQLSRLVPTWRANPHDRPHVILGAAGPLSHRYVAGSLRLDRDELLRDDLREVVPVDDDLDAHELRGVRISNCRFSRLRHALFIWVDGAGQVRYGQSTGWQPT